MTSEHSNADGQEFLDFLRGWTVISEESELAFDATNIREGG
jgi:hypothetical protein